MVPSVRIMLSGFLACSTADTQHVSKSRVGSAGAGTPSASGPGPQPNPPATPCKLPHCAQNHHIPHLPIQPPQLTSCTSAEACRCRTAAPTRSSAALISIAQASASTAAVCFSSCTSAERNSRQAGGCGMAAAPPLLDAPPPGAVAVAAEGPVAPLPLPLLLLAPAAAAPSAADPAAALLLTDARGSPSSRHRSTTSRPTRKPL